MARRTRRIAIDQDNSWIYRAFYETDLSGDITIEHDADFIFLSYNGEGDDPDYVGLTRPIFTSLTDGTEDVTIWANGLISLGAPTQAQQDFMNTATALTDFSAFPGNYISVGFLTDIDQIFFGARPDHSEFLFTNTNTGVTVSVFMYGDRFEVIGGSASGGLDFGTGVTLPATGNGTEIYDLTSLITVEGTDGPDTINGTAAPQTIRGLGGNDVLTAGLGAVTLVGGGGDDTLTGSKWSDKLLGGTGNDTIFAGPGDYVEGRDGNDRITVFVGQRDEDEDVVIKGGPGLDRAIFNFSEFGIPAIVNLPPGPTGTISGYKIDYESIERFTVIGSKYNDTIRGGNGPDALFGGNGADLIVGGAGNDTLHAGKGGQAPEPPLTSGGEDRLSALPIDDIFNPAKSGLDPYVRVDIYTDGNANFFTDDFFAFTAADSDHFKVGFLDPSADPFVANWTLTLYDSDGNVVAQESSSQGNLPSLDVQLAAGQYVVEIQSDNQFQGFGTLEATIELASADIVERHNVLRGGVGDDTYKVFAIDDVTIEKPGEGHDTVFSAVDWQLGRNFEDLRLIGTANLSGQGNPDDNRLFGNAGANYLGGFGGNDRIDGGKGADNMLGGPGDDTYVVDNAGDQVHDGAGLGFDTVVTTVNFALPANIEKLVLSGNGAIRGTGNGEDNVIVGNGAANAMFGQNGNDLLAGKGGNDTLRGGNGDDNLNGGDGTDVLFGDGGADRFVFDLSGLAGSVARANSERIGDFSQSDGDRIDLHLIDANATLGDDQAFNFIGTAAFGLVKGQLRYEKLAASTIVEGDINGDGTADFVIRLNGTHDLVRGDFIL